MQLFKKTLLRSFLIDSIIILLVLFFLHAFIPYQETILYNPDEGLELIKVRLLNAGYSLYSEIWSDQPPGYTLLLSIWSKTFGETVSDARFLTIIFSILLLLSFRRIVSIHLGEVVSIYGVTALFFSESYIKLSVSTMQALPSLALGTFSLYLLMASHRVKEKHKILMSLAAGIVVGLAITCKLWIVALLPVLQVCILTNKISEPQNSCKLFRLRLFRDRLLESNFLVFNFTWILTLVFFLSIVFSFHYEQLVGTHFGENIYEHMDISYLLRPLVKYNQNILVLASASVTAIFISYLHKQEHVKLTSESMILPVVWLLSDFLLFWNHRPLWFHYYHIFIIPMIWLACYFPIWLSYNLVVKLQFAIHHFNSFALGSIQLTSIRVKALRSFVLISSITAFLYFFKGEIISYSHGKANSWDREHEQLLLIVDNIKNHNRDGQYIYTNHPILAVYAGLLIPPEIAVLGKQIKRVEYAESYNDRLLDAFQKYNVEQVILVDENQQLIDNVLQGYIDKYYKLIDQDNDIFHYVLEERDATFPHN